MAIFILMKIFHIILTSVDMTDDGFGGVFLACNNKFVSRAIPITSECEIVASCIELTCTEKAILCAIYRPPNRGINYLQQLCKDIEYIISEEQNLPNTDWENHVVKDNSGLSHLTL